VTDSRPTPSSLLAHNVDALLALGALPVFALAGWPLDGWFWAVVLWGLNRYVQIVIERRAARAGALRGVGMLGASMLVRPWVGMLALFLITKDHKAVAISSVLLFLGLLTIDIATRVVVHRSVRRDAGRTV
jgi:hypothetical protein